MARGAEPRIVDVAAMEHARLARKISSWSEVATRAGVPRQTLSRWLVGSADGSKNPETVTKVAAVLGLSYEEMTRPKSERITPMRNYRNDPQFKRDVERARQELAKYPLTQRTRTVIATIVHDLAGY